MRKSATRLIHAPMVLLDEAIRFLIAFEDYQYTRQLLAESSTFALQLARLRGDLLSIRELILLGQESSALALARVFVEDIEIAMSIAIDPLFANEYRSAEAEDSFWSKNIGYGNIYPKIKNFFERGGGSIDQVTADLDYHKRLKTFLSAHIHPTHSSALRTAFPPALHRPGAMFARPLGVIGSNLGPLCLFLAEEVHSFAACCINIFIQPDPPPALAGYKPNGQLDDAIGAAHVLQELVLKYADSLRAAHEVSQDQWKTILGAGQGNEV